MDIIIKQVVMLFTTCFLFFYAENHKDKDTYNYNLNVTVENLRNSKGLVLFAIYNKDGSIPDENFEKYYKIQKEKIIDNRAETNFKDLPEGTYAVSILHDENENSKIDKGFLLPKEGIGFSNITKIGITNKPNFQKASFELKKDSKITIKIIYM